MCLCGRVLVVPRWAWGLSEGGRDRGEKRGMGLCSWCLSVCCGVLYSDVLWFLVDQVWGIYVQKRFIYAKYMTAAWLFLIFQDLKCTTKLKSYCCGHISNLACSVKHDIYNTNTNEENFQCFSALLSWKKEPFAVPETHCTFGHSLKFCTCWPLCNCFYYTS